MCLTRRTWGRVHGGMLLLLCTVMLVGWGRILFALQSQDGINATLSEQMQENRTRIARLEGWQEKVDERLSRLTWLTGAASGPLILEVFKYLIRSRRPEKPNRINERRRYDDHDEE